MDLYIFNLDAFLCGGCCVSRWIRHHWCYMSDFSASTSPRYLLDCPTQQSLSCLFLPLKVPDQMPLEILPA